MSSRRKYNPVSGSSIGRFGGNLNRPAFALMFAFVLALASGVAAHAQEEDRSGDVKALGNCEGCVFENKDFSGQRLTGIDLSTAQLSNVILDNAALNIAVFDGAILRDVSFVGSNLKGASFVGARLENVIFDNANLTAAVFDDAILDGTDLQAAVLCNTQIPGDLMDRSDCE